MKQFQLLLENIQMNSYSWLCTFTSLLWVNKINLSSTSYEASNKATEVNTQKEKN